METQRTVYTTPLDALLALARSLTLFEPRYGKSTEQFYAQYQAGSLGDGRDMVEWAGDFQHYQELKAQLEIRLETVPSGISSAAAHSGSVIPWK